MLLIQNGSVLTMDKRDTIYTPGWVWIEQDRIGAVGAGQPPVDFLARAKRVIDATHLAVLPGLINAHTHLSQTFMRGLGDDKPLLDWLKQVMWPLQAAMTPAEMRLAALLGLVENLRCGATAVGQHHKIITSSAHVDAAAEAAETVGLRMQLARGWVDLGTNAESPEAILAEMSRLRERWHGQAEGRITVAFGPLAAWRCSDESMRRTFALAREWGMRTHIHVAEAKDEIELMRQRNGLGHIEWLHALGLLGPEMQLVHCVWVSEAEIDLIAESRSVVVHCPVSNMYLASGAAPLRRMLDRGVAVALGTDGPASHNSQDLLETLKIAALLAKVSTGQATALLPLEALRLVTTAGARFWGREDVGRIVPGCKADLTLVNLNTTRSMPVHRPESAVVYNASGADVHTVIVDGRILLDAARVTMLDEAALLEECRGAAKRLLNRAGVVVNRG
ncbi:MAG TPA: amidohydrolase [Anaerolineae bacterium]|nr:amidohydrolase [Anaerolineae bacterium]